MERPKPPDIAQEYGDLQSRFLKAARPVKRQPHQKALRRVSERQLRYLPDLKIGDADLPGIETYVLFIERLKAFELAEKNALADRALTQALSLAKKLDYELPGNDGAVKFFFEANLYLERVNPGLAENSGRVIQKAWDERRFKDKQ